MKQKSRILGIVGALIRDYPIICVNLLRGVE